MGADHHYVAPKTDGTFGLKVNWAKLSKGSVAVDKASSSTLPFQPIQPVTTEELQTKTLREWWNWREWRKSSPLQQFNVRGNWANYCAVNFKNGMPNGKVVGHVILGLLVTGFIASYPKNSNHLHAEHH